MNERERNNNGSGSQLSAGTVERVRGTIPAKRRDGPRVPDETGTGSGPGEVSRRRKITCEEAFLSVQNLLRERAWAFSKKTGHPFEDLYGEAVGYFVAAYRRWDPSARTLASWTHLVVTGNLMNYTMKNRMSDEPEPAVMEALHVTTLDASSSIGFRDEIESWPEEMRYVAKVLLEAPAELLGLLGTETPHGVKMKLKTHLKSRGWSWARIKSVYQQLEQALS